MYELIKTYQLDIMLVLCGVCSVLAFLLIITRFLSKQRKRILVCMEFVAVFLLAFDREAYVFAGDPSKTGYIMVRLSNFMVFYLTSCVVFMFNLYLKDYIKVEGKQKSAPKRLQISGVLATLGMLLAIVAAFTNLYYYFDETNLYHRGPGFLLAYIVPVVCPLLQFTVVLQYRKIFSKLINIALNLYIFVPLACGIIQIYAYGISIVNMAMVVVSISLFVFTYLDINDTVEHAHQIEIENIQGQQVRMKRLFNQTANAFVSAVEKKDDFTVGNAAKVAEYAEQIAKMAGMSDEESERVYYAALLHDVGMIGIPDSVIKNEADPGKWDREMMRQKPVFGNEILSRITEFPFLSEGAHYSHERYNGTGYPEGLSGEEIPEIARIIAVADAYVTMTSKKRYRDAKPDFVAREALVKGRGEEFDPKFANLMIKIIDDNSNKTAGETNPIETELICGKYRDHISCGIPIEYVYSKITFDCILAPDMDKDFSAPSIVLFDSYDSRVHEDPKAIEAYHYQEYGEVWFDEHSISTSARKIAETVREREAETSKGQKYEIITGRYEDHLKLVMKSPSYEKEVIVALQNGSQAAYVGLTGENCSLININVEKTEEAIGPDDIPRIADEISYIERMEADLKNVQIDRTRSASTDGVEIKNRLRLMFHTMSLPGAGFVWHCPYIILFHSNDGKVYGENYHEYSLIKLYGENDGDSDYSKNTISVKRTEEFLGWDAWKDASKAGMECDVLIKRKDNKIVLKTKNFGIELENTTTITEDFDKVYVAITGDQVALTDIRIK